MRPLVSGISVDTVRIHRPAVDLTAASLDGIFARMYQMKYPAHVASMVLVSVVAVDGILRRGAAVAGNVQISNRYTNQMGEGRPASNPRKCLWLIHTIS